ncbi:MAG: hypothetical protein JW953_05620 [Anaerolineae bacterium]|nr:hypothetical protein [Anaerolineae bacterium]
MSAEIKTVIGQLSIAGGSWRGDPPNQVAVREPKSAPARGAGDTPGVGKGDLFVLTEARGPVSNRDNLERQLAEAIRDAYYLARGSVTASLRRALQTASDQLYRHNCQAGAPEKVVAGVVAVVVRNTDIFVAQLGPAALFTVLGSHIRRYPAQSAWLDEALTPAKNAPALGSSSLIEPNLHHLRVGPEDMLILADSRLAGQLPLTDVLNAVDPRSVKASVKNLGKTARARDGSALVLAVVEAEHSTLEVLKNAPNVLARGAPVQLNRFFKRGRHQPVTAENAISSSAMTMPIPEAVAESQPAAKENTAAFASPRPGRFFSRQAETTNGKIERQASVPAKQTSARSRPGTHRAEYRDSARPKKKSKITVKEEAAMAEEYYDLDRQLGRQAKELASVVQESSFRAEWRQSQQPSPTGKILRWLGASLFMLIALLGTGLKNILTLVLPRAGVGHTTRQAGAHAYRQQTSSVSWSLLRNIAIAIPLLVVIVVGISYLQKGRMLEAEYKEFVTSAQNKFQQAQAIAATDPSTALGLMTEAETALVEAEKLKAGQPEITELRQHMAGMSDEIGNVQRLYYLPLLRSYPDAGANLKRIVVQGVELYVLDSGTDRIFHHRLDDLGETLLPDDESLVLVSRGQAVEQVTVADILDMTWMPAGGNRQTSDLVVLNSTGLLEYDPSWNMTTAALAGGELLALPAAVSSYYGNFYILDPQANRLLRYLPTADGYSAPPEDYFPAEQAVDLSNAVDLAIDGAVYVLFRDGRLNKYEAGRPAAEFQVRGLDKPFHNPVSVFTAPDEEVQYVYVADAGNQRIVQLEKDGRFIRQFKPREGEPVSFANLQSIFVDEIGGRLYILDSNNLYVGNIPSQSVESEPDTVNEQQN